MKVYEYELTVTKDNIDALNHVNNVVYLQWINMVSVKHWKLLSNDKINAKYNWVASRHEIDYLKPAFLNDTIKLKTYIETLEGVKSIRKVAIYKKEVLIAKSSTTWILLDAKTQRITRIPTEILKLF